MFTFPHFFFFLQLRGSDLLSPKVLSSLSICEDTPARLIAQGTVLFFLHALASFLGIFSILIFTSLSKVTNKIRFKLPVTLNHY